MDFFHKQIEKSNSGLAHSGDFHHKMCKAGRHCEAAQPTKQSMFIIALRSSGLLRCTHYALCKNQGSLACGQENSILAGFLFLAPE
jgi:hypothetical protein